MDLLNKMAVHPVFGEGTVTSLEGNRITVCFQGEAGEKRFSYPTVFEKYLKMADSAAQEFAVSQLKEMMDGIRKEREKKEAEFMEEHNRKPVSRSAAKKAPVRRAVSKKTVSEKPI